MGDPVLAIRELRMADVPFAMELKNMAKWNQVEADWYGYLSYEPAGCFLAELDGEPAGTATVVTYEGAVGWIGMVLVHPERRRFGIGTALLHRSIRYLQEAGIASIKLDATPMGRHVYVPLGFVDEYEVTRYEGIVPEKAANPFTLGTGMIPALEVDVAELAAFDRQAFGADRTHVLRSLIGRAPQLSFVSRNAAGEIDGYLLAHQGYDAVQLGPWVACAPSAAEALLTAAFRRLAGKAVFLDVPAPNEDGVQLMKRHGFKVQRGFARMVLGSNAAPGRPEWVYGTSGAEKG